MKKHTVKEQGEKEKTMHETTKEKAEYVWKEIRWNENRSEPWLLLIKEGEVYPFRGRNIPGVCAIIGENWEDNGKWYGTTYRMLLTEEARALPGREGFNIRTFRAGLAEKIGKKCDRWCEIAEALGVTQEATERFLRKWRPQEAEALDETEAALKSL